MLGANVVRIPLRLIPGEMPAITEEDITLYDGDVVLIESRESDVFFTGGLLGGGRFTLPRDQDLDVLQALAIVQSQPIRSYPSRAIGGPAATNQDRSAIFFVVTVALVIGGVLICPRAYRSEAKLFVRMGRESVTLDPTATTGQIVAVHESRENEINSVLEVVHSRVILSQVVDKLGPNLILYGTDSSESSTANAETGGHSPLREKAVRTLEKTVDVKHSKKSSVITIGCKAQSPEIAQRIVNEILNAFHDLHLKVNRTAGSHEFFIEQTALLKTKLDKATAALRDAKNELGLVTIEGRRNGLQEQIRINRSAIEANITELAAARATIASLKQTLATLPTQMESQRVVGFPNGAADRARTRYNDLKLLETELLAKFTPSSPQVKSVRKQLDDALRILQREDTLSAQSTTAVNPARQQLKIKLLTESSRIASLVAREKSLEQQKARLLEQLKALNGEEGRLAGLAQDVELLRASHRTYSEKLEQTRIDGALGEQRISNVNVVQPATYVTKPVSPKRRIIVILGAFVAAVGAIGLAFATEFVRKAASAEYGMFNRLSAVFADPVVRKGALSVFDQAIVSGTSFLTSVAIGRLCTQAELGVYYLALSIVLFGRGIQEQLVSAPYTIYCNRHRGDALARYTGSVFAHQFVLILATICGLLAFAAITATGFGPAGFSTTAWIMIASVPALLLREHLRQFAFARLTPLTAIVIDAAVCVFQLSTLGVLAYCDLLSAATAFGAMGAACAIATIGWWFCKRQPITITRGRIVSDWIRNWSFSRWALASHLVGSSTPYVMPWFVAAVQGNAATGVMAACNTIVGLANSFVMGLSNYLTPKAAHAYANGGVPELRRVLWKTSLLFTATIGTFCVAAFFAGDYVAVLLYGDAYSGRQIVRHHHDGIRVPPDNRFFTVNETETASMNQQDISIIVCTYNRAEMLRGALQSLTSLRTQGEFTYEILVIDNASTDHTAEVVDEIARDSILPVRRAREDQKGVVHARNRGVAEARGEWIAFFDDDQLADEFWLASLLKAAREQDVRCVGGAVHLKLPDGVNRDLAPVCRMLLGETVGMNSPRPYNHRVTPGTGNLMIHSSVFNEIGVFDPAFHQRGEDTNLFLRMLDAGITGWFTPQAIVHHLIPAERLEADYLTRVSKLLVEGMATDERKAWGGVRYPLIWCARVAQAGMLFVPRMIWARIRQDRERLLGAKCRLAIAAKYLRDGWFLMLPQKMRPVDLRSDTQEPDIRVIVLNFILIFCAALILLPIMVFCGECLLSILLRRDKPSIEVDTRPRVAVLIPAHDEAAVIGDTLATLIPTLRSGDRVLVVADNCTDDTAAVARTIGADVVERRDSSQRGKAYALEFGIQALAANPPDVVVVLDADCTVDADLVLRISNLAYSRHRPVQCRNLSVADDGAEGTHAISELGFHFKNLVHATDDPSLLAERMDDVIARFEKQWRAGTTPSIAAYLSENNDIAAELLFELVKVDLEQQWRRANQSARNSPRGANSDDSQLASVRYLEEYLIEFPELTSRPEALLELAGEEYRVRHRWGDRPLHDEYTARYNGLDAGRIRRAFKQIDDQLAADVAKRSTLGEMDNVPTVIGVEGARPRDSSTLHENDDPAASELQLEIREEVATGEQALCSEVEFIRDFLVHTHPFSELPKGVNEEIARRMQERRIPKGEPIIRQGEIARDLLVLTEGVAEVCSVDDGNQSHVITRVGSHTVLGEIALLTREPRSANVTAVTDVLALALDVDDFHQVALRFPTLNVIFSELVAERVGTVGLDVLCGKTLSGYRIEQRLGRGSMGVVYEATELESNLRVALKMMSHALIYDHQAVSRFHRETEIVESLKHPNIIRSHGKFTALNTFFIVMEYCDGLPLSTVLQLSAGLPESEVRNLLGQLAAALSYTHQLNVVHRDIKPGNIFVQWDGQLKLMDFGLARSVANPELTQCGQILGTPRYMPPEQLAGSPVGYEADIFAMGCIAYELISGDQRFQGSDVVSLLRQQLEWTMPERTELAEELVSEELYSLIATCLAKDPGERNIDLEQIASWAGPFDMKPFAEIMAAEDEDSSEDPTVVHDAPPDTGNA
eukprot:g26543.t1